MLCWCMVHLAIEEVSSLVLPTALPLFNICCECGDKSKRKAATVARRASQVSALRGGES